MVLAHKMVACFSSHGSYSIRHRLNAYTKSDEVRRSTLLMALAQFFLTYVTVVVTWEPIAVSDIYAVQTSSFVVYVDLELIPKFHSCLARGFSRPFSQRVKLWKISSHIHIYSATKGYVSDAQYIAMTQPSQYLIYVLTVSFHQCFITLVHACQYISYLLGLLVPWRYGEDWHLA